MSCNFLGKKVVNGTLRFMTDGFKLCPFMFDRIKVWRAGGQKRKNMPGVADAAFTMLTLVEGGIIHHHHAVGGQFGYQILCDPCAKNVGVDGTGKHRNRQ
jgi:hypothetical protein